MVLLLCWCWKGCQAIGYCTVLGSSALSVETSTGETLSLGRYLGEGAVSTVFASRDREGAVKTITKHFTALREAEIVESIGR
jgi:hypothetical protein